MKVLQHGNLRWADLRLKINAKGTYLLVLLLIDTSFCVDMYKITTRWQNHTSKIWACINTYSNNILQNSLLSFHFTAQSKVKVGGWMSFLFYRCGEQNLGRQTVMSQRPRVVSGSSLHYIAYRHYCCSNHSLMVPKSHAVLHLPIFSHQYWKMSWHAAPLEMCHSTMYQWKQMLGWKRQTFPH